MKKTVVWKALGLGLRIKGAFSLTIGMLGIPAALLPLLLARQLQKLTDGLMAMSEGQGGDFGRTMEDLLWLGAIFLLQLLMDFLSDYVKVNDRYKMLTKEQADHSSIQNVLTRCVGVQEEVYPDLFFGEVQRDAVYMLCSDGFRHRITEDEMQKYLRRPAEGSLQMKRQEEYLIELNKQRGETDNISVITIHTER